MAKTIRYQKMVKMAPRDGVKYSTTYVKQTPAQRMELMRHIRTCVTEIAQALEQQPSYGEFMTQPLKGFPTTRATNRNMYDIITDMVNEGRGHQRDGTAKDFALAPIERWNKLFAGTPYEIALVQTYGSAVNTFNDLMEFGNEI